MSHASVFCPDFVQFYAKSWQRKPPMADKKRDRPTWIRFSGVGFEFTAAVVGFALIGYWIDYSWNSQPWGVLIGVVLGLVGGTYNLIRESTAAFKEFESKEAGDDREGSDSP